MKVFFNSLEFTKVRDSQYHFYIVSAALFIGIFLNPQMTDIGGTIYGSTKFNRIFTAIYDNNEWIWGSGAGSRPDTTVEYRALLQQFFHDPKIKTIVDLGCGDWQIMKLITIPDDKKYIGLDVVDYIIDDNIREFGKTNVIFRFTNGEFKDLPEGDLLIVKDVLIHWDLEQINSFIKNVLPLYKQVLITSDYDNNHPLYNADITIGHFRPVDLTDHPFFVKMKLLLEYKAHGASKRVYLYDNSDHN